MFINFVVAPKITRVGDFVFMGFHNMKTAQSLFHSINSKSCFLSFFTRRHLKKNYFLKKLNDAEGKERTTKKIV